MWWNPRDGRTYLRDAMDGRTTLSRIVLAYPEEVWLAIAPGTGNNILGTARAVLSIVPLHLGVVCPAPDSRMTLGPGLRGPQYAAQIVSSLEVATRPRTHPLAPSFHPNLIRWLIRLNLIKLQALQVEFDTV